MRRRHLVLAALAAPVTVAIILVGRQGRPTPSTQVELVPRARYRLRYEQEAQVAGQTHSPLLVEGAWITTPRGAGRSEARLVARTLDGPEGQLPDASDLEAPAHLYSDDGVLGGIGFAPGTRAPARRLMTALATTFQVSDRPGSSWIVDEEDLVGRYVASYERAGGQVLRTRTAYTALRGEGGLGAANGQVMVAEDARFRFDDRGLVGATIELDVTIDSGKELPRLRLVLRAELERTSIDLVPIPTGPLFPSEPISGHADAELAAAKRNADESLVADAAIDELVAEALRIAALPPGSATNKDRATLMVRLGAKIRLSPGSAADVAKAILEYADDLSTVRLLAGGLASAEVAEATNALAGLVGKDLPEEVHKHLVGALHLSSPATDESVRALAQAIDGPGREVAALALGAHARMARETMPERAAEATARLLTEYADSADPEDRKLFLTAFGNTGDRQVLPALQEAIEGPEREMARVATYSLRFVPGDEVEALLVQATTRPELALQAIRAVEFRAPAQWRDRLLELRRAYADNNLIQTKIRTILRRWS